MLKSLLTKGMMIALLAACSLQSSFAQVFWSEDFSNQASSTANWVHGGTNPGAEVWKWTNDPTLPSVYPEANWIGTFAPTAATGYFMFDSDTNGENNTHDVSLTNVNAPINCTGKSDVHLTFNTMYATFTTDDSPRVGISTDGVNFTYLNIPTLDAVPQASVVSTAIDLDISQYADNQAQVWIQFRYEATWELFWKVDDLQLTEVPPQVFDVTFRVNASLITVDPAGMKIAGSFTNWADADMVDQGNGLWTYTAQLTEGVQALYKFKNGPNGWESGQAACGVSDGFGGFNRAITPTASATLSAVCFNECGPCNIAVPCNLNPDAIICDNFDSYNVAQKLGPQSTNWTTWSGTEGTNEDGIVSTEQANTAPNSLKILSTAATGGPQDVVLDLGNKTAGNYALNWKMYVPAGKQAYYNLQNVVPIVAGDWNYDVYFDANGVGRVGVGSPLVLMGTFTYNYGEWFDVKHTFDLDNNIGTLTINGTTMKFAFQRNLGGVDFYGANASNQYYVDDVEYIELPAATFEADVCETAVDLTGYLGNSASLITTPVSAGPFDITNATLDPSDPTTGFECHFDGDPLQASQWFTFEGTGGTYTITSTACGANPIPLTDTQFSLYTGSCGNYTSIDCNDDVDVANNVLNSTLTVETTLGETYYLLVDSYGGEAGTYCLEISSGNIVDCAAGEVGINTVSNDGFVCWGGNLGDIMVFDPTTYTLPNSGVSGHLWCISAEPLDPNVWPGDVAGIASTTASQSIIAVGLPNDASAFPPGSYYLTSVVLGDGTLINSAQLPRVFNIDITNGCFYVGESQLITLVPELQPIIAFASVEPGTVAGTVNILLDVTGGIAEAVGDPSLYVFEWSNGSEDQNLIGVPDVANYEVTISDPTGCTDSFVITNVSTTDPASVKSLTLTPNPTTGLLNLNMTLEKSANVQVEVFNALGQLIETIQAGNTASLSRSIDLSSAATGLYTVRITMDNDTAVRRIAVQR